MGKYRDIVESKNQAGKPDNQKTVNIDSSKTSKQQNNKTGNTDSQKTSDADNQKTINTDSQKTSDADNQKAINEDMVNLSIKVPRKLRQKWVAESRLRGTTLTAIITDYLKSELGE